MFKKLSTTQKLLVIFVGLLMLSCLCIATVIATRDTSAPEAPPATLTVDSSPTARPTIVQPAAVTPTHQPTASPTAAIPTRKPTASPSPTIDSVSAYTSEVTTWLSPCYESISYLGELSTLASEAPLLFYNDDWKGLVHGTLDMILATCPKMAEVHPVPEPMQKFHSYIVLMADETREMVDDYRRGVDEHDVDSIVAATAHMERAAEYLNQAAESIKK